MKRFVELDILRGFLLLMMVVNHAPTYLRVFTDQPIGFFSTAEAFVFVSAFLAGLLFQRRSDKQGFDAARAATVSRALRIYRAHVGTLLFAFIVGGIFLAELPGIQNLLYHYFQNPGAAVVAAFALIFQPPLMDILPMYILFSLLTPCAFWAAKRWGWKRVLFVSLGLWVLSQFRLREMFLANVKGASFLDLGPFDLLAWQLLWVGGLVFGKAVQEGRPSLQLSATAETVVFIAAFVFLVLRWDMIAGNFDPGRQLWILDKWHLGPVRLMNFFAVAWVVSRVLPGLQRWETPLRPFSLVGQNMLPVFCCEICLSLLLVGAIDPSKSHKPLVSALVVGQMLSAFLIAWALNARSTARSSQGLLHDSQSLAQ
jgi:hypothetical protein